MISRVFLILFLFSFPCNNLYTIDIQNMSLEEKVGQLLIAHFHGEMINKDAKTLVQKTKVGGIIYYSWSNGLNSLKQVQNLSRGLQELAKENRIPVPLFIATDQEGGAVTRLSGEFTAWPGNRALAMAGDLDLAEACILAMALELNAGGINMNFSPVVDVANNPRNPVIGIRAFGTSAETVSAFGKQVVEGYKQRHIIATLKHFPGLGDVTVDPHEGLPILSKSLEELEKVELVPFRKLAPSVDAIMTAHVLVPAFDEKSCATLSEKTLNYLKNQMEFKGLIIADSLAMQGVLKRCHTVEEAAIQALNAGCDMLILGGRQLLGEHIGFELTPLDIQNIHHAILSAVKSGHISETRVDEAVKKILHLKEYYCTNQQTQFNIAHHREVAQKLASLALTTVKNSEISFDQKKIVIFAPEEFSLSINQTSLLKIGQSANLCTFKNLNPSIQEIEAARKYAKQADVLLACSYNAWKNPSQITLIQSLLEMGKPTILLVLGDPLDASFFPKTDLTFTTYSPTTPSIQAVCNQLEN